MVTFSVSFLFDNYHYLQTFLSQYIELVWDPLQTYVGLGGPKPAVRQIWDIL